MGILNREVQLKWNPTIINFYTEKGYPYTKTGETFAVRIEDLQNNSNINVNVECDYCGTKSLKRYKNIFDSINSSFTKKYACHKCQSKKIFEENEIKQKLGMLTRNDKGYWLFKENRMMELDNFIKNNDNSLDFLAIKDRTLYSAIINNDGSVNTLVEELGYSYNDICSISLNNFYKEFDNVKDRLEEFISEHNRFPTKNEIINTLKIQQRDIDFHGGMFELKRKMKYVDKDDLVDDNGFINSSSIEHTVAQFLIKNRIPYKREQFPFTKDVGKYRSDFTIETPNKTYHVEVWGYSDKHGGGFSYKYIERKKEKLHLYQKYNISLISIDYEYIVRKSSKSINKYLTDKFSVVNSIIS